MSLPLRERSDTRPPRTSTSARTPSHFTSYDHRSSCAGSGPVVASIGERARGRATRSAYPVAVAMRAGPRPGAVWVTLEGPGGSRRARSGAPPRRTPTKPMTSTWTWSGLRSWVVHGYTATGAVLALLIVLAAVEGDVARALWLGLAALVIDGTDGMLARRFGVKERLPWFDGALLDNIVDYLTYVFAPVVLLLQTGFLPNGTTGTVVAVVPLVASSYQFCRVDAKTDDHFFLGFPSYWNVVAFYAIAMDLSPLVTSTVIVVCAALVLVPVGYIYPSRMTVLRTPTLVLSAVWLVLYAVIVAQLPSPEPLVIAASLGYIAYYCLLSLYLDRRRRTARAAQPPVTVAA